MPVDLRANITTTPAAPQTELTYTYQVTSGSATLNGALLTANTNNPVTVKVTVADGYGNSYSESFTLTVAAASELDISSGNIVISKSGNGYKVEYGNGLSQTYDANADIVITGTSNANTITVKSGSPKVTLKNVSISNSSTAPFSVESGAAVNLTLAGTNTLDITGARQVSNWRLQPRPSWVKLSRPYLLTVMSSL